MEISADLWIIKLRWDNRLRLKPKQLLPSSPYPPPSTAVLTNSKSLQLTAHSSQRKQHLMFWAEELWNLSIFFKSCSAKHSASIRGICMTPCTLQHKLQNPSLALSSYHPGGRMPLNCVHQTSSELVGTAISWKWNTDSISSSHHWKTTSTLSWALSSPGTSLYLTCAAVIQVGSVTLM